MQLSEQEAFLGSFLASVGIHRSDYSPQTDFQPPSEHNRIGQISCKPNEFVALEMKPRIHPRIKNIIGADSHLAVSVPSLSRNTHRCLTAGREAAGSQNLPQLLLQNRRT